MLFLTVNMTVEALFLFYLQEKFGAFLSYNLHLAIRVPHLWRKIKWLIWNPNVFKIAAKLSLSSRTSLLQKCLISFFGVGLPWTVCVFMGEVTIQHNIRISTTYWHLALLQQSPISSQLCNSLGSKTSNSSLIGSSVSPYTINPLQNQIKEATNSDDLSGNMHFKLSISAHLHVKYTNHFWATHVNQNWTFFPVNKHWHFQICTAKRLSSDKKICTKSLLTSAKTPFLVSLNQFPKSPK